MIEATTASRAPLQHANVLLASGQFEDAIRAYDAYVSVQPDSGEAWHNRGIALARTRRFAHAAQSFGKALTLHPESAASWHNRGLALTELEEFPQAISDISRALSINPMLSSARGDLLLAKLNCCDWRDFEAQRHWIASAIQAGEPAIAPFGNLLISDSPALQLQCARNWMAAHVAGGAVAWRGPRYAHERIRIAYVSGDFRSHPVGAVILPLFEGHDRSRFETFAISFGPDDGSEVRRRSEAAVDHFTDLRQSSDGDIAGFIREHEIDIAIDLMGITADCRPNIFASRPSPIQVGYLGFPATMGAAFMDYVIADRIVAPHPNGFAEKIVRLGNCYMPASVPPALDCAAPRSAFGLPEDKFVFCCFNNHFKIIPESFDSWMRILTAANESVLWLAEPNRFAQANLQREAAKRGVSPDRLIFAPRLPSVSDHLRRIAAADVFLDTLPFNAHSTAIDALSVGVPVVTVSGAAMAARTCASIVAAAGIPELIAGSRAQYEELATGFARSRPALGDVKAKLKRMRSIAPLFDPALFIADFETALCEMHNRYMSDVAPDDFAVAERRS